MKKLILSIFFVFSLFLSINVANANLSLNQYSDNEEFTVFMKQDPIEAKVTIFPNPLTKDNLTIETDTKFFEIEVLNIIGKSVYKKELEPGSTKEVIYFKDFDRGWYLVRLKFGDKSIYTEKVLVK